MGLRMRALGIFAFAALALFLSGCLSSGAQGSAGIQEKFSLWWGAWSMPIYAAFGLGIAICTFTWFYSSFMQDEKLKAWAKSELVQLGYSAVILLAIAAVIGSVAFVSAEIPKIGGIGGGQIGAAWGDYVWARCVVNPVLPERPCHIRLAEDYLEILSKSTQAQAAAILRYLAFLYPLSSVGISFKGIPAPGGALSISPLGGITPPIETMNFVFQMLMKNLLAVRAQQFAVDFMHVAFFPYMVAAGIFLRTMHFTRKLGGLLIALGFAFYIVLPLMYVFWMSILFSFTGPWVASPSGAYDPAYVGSSMMVDTYSFGSINTGKAAPIAAAKSYDEQIPQDYDIAGSRGDYCGNGVVEPWEECGEENGALVAGTTKTYEEIYGKQFACSGGGEVCDTNSCTCTSGVYAGGTGDFSQDYSTVQEQTDEFYYINNLAPGEMLDERARVLANMCFEAPADQNQAAQFLDVARKAWYERLLEGFGGGFARAIPSDFLLGANGTIDNAAKLLVFSLVAPFISLMVALATVKVLSPAFGGDVEIAGLSRLV
ncbi:MAG: hypothetical protein V1822_02120 [Candidatus Micrarchaeota archaeon]